MAQFNFPGPAFTQLCRYGSTTDEVKQTTEALLAHSGVAVPTPGYRGQTELMEKLRHGHQRHLDQMAGQPLVDALNIDPVMPRYQAPGPDARPVVGGSHLVAAGEPLAQSSQAALTADDSVSASPPPPGVTAQAYQALVDEMRAIRRDVARATPKGRNANYIQPLEHQPRSTQLVLIFNTDGSQIRVGPPEKRTVQSVMKTISVAKALRDGAHPDVTGCLPTTSPFNQPSTVGNRDNPQAITEANDLKNQENYAALSDQLRAQGDARPANGMNNIGAVLYSALQSGVVRLRGGHDVEMGSLGRIFNLVNLVERLAAGPDGPGERTRIDTGVALGERIDSPGNWAYAELAMRQLQPQLGDAGRSLLAGEAYATYIDQCSLSMDAEKLTRVLSTVFNDGVNPRTGERVLSVAEARAAVGQMRAAGLYESTLATLAAAGYFGKSGVGGMLMVKPELYDVTLGVCDEPLDAAGNSEMGQAMISRLLASAAFQTVMRQIDLHRGLPPRLGATGRT